MKIYILGCGGMLGDALYKHLKSLDYEVLATDIQLTSDWVKYQDVCDSCGIHQTIQQFKPDAIINLAAMTDMERCEQFPDLAIEINALGSAYCAEEAYRLDIPYVYISTAGIFGGCTKEYYDDDDKPIPACVYARGKYWGELIAQTVSKHIVLRCGWQMGSGPKDKKFIQKIWKQIKAGATELNVVTDKGGSPTYVTDFSMQIETLLRNRCWGTFNTVCKGFATRYDVAMEFVKLLGLPIKVNVVPSTFWKKQFFAPRPASEKLLTLKLDATGLNVMRPWKEALSEYVKEYADYFSLEK